MVMTSLPLAGLDDWKRNAATPAGSASGNDGHSVLGRHSVLAHGAALLEFAV
jgi:hypothetical protein